jgi:hypothetical protein
MTVTFLYLNVKQLIQKLENTSKTSYPLCMVNSFIFISYLKDLMQICGFLWVLVSSTNKTTGSREMLKVALNTITLTPI